MRPTGILTVTAIGDGVAVASGNRLVWCLDLSPDEKWIAYEDDFRGQSDIYKAPVAGGPAIRLTDTPRNELSPEWSPDGSEISFEAPTADGAMGRFELWTMPANGGTPTQITPPAPDGGSHMYAEWMPGGRHLTFGQVGGLVSDGIWVMERDAPGRPWGEPRRIAESGHAYGALDESSVLVTYPSSRGDGVAEQISLDGEVLWSRNIPATSALREWGRHTPAAVSPDGQTIYSNGVHEDGTHGLWAIGDRGRGEPRLQQPGHNGVRVTDC
jgi:dipeptidyl aminopeptidase/acylaminoacyl peptidase